jgi:hypothetical protein
VTSTQEPTRTERAAVELYWVPLGAGGARIVRLNGRAYEAVHARLEGRTAMDLYHCALQVRVPEGRFSIELTPVPDVHGAARGVVGEGPVGSRLLGRFRVFRYELRCWREGTIPDLRYAVGGPRTLTDDPALARAVLRSTAAAPTLVWGRDELRTGEMWNSNSVIAWVLASSGVPLAAAAPPPRGRAPGWRAGLVVARRGQPERSVSSTRPSSATSIISANDV